MMDDAVDEHIHNDLLYMFRLHIEPQRPQHWIAIHLHVRWHLAAVVIECIRLIDLQWLNRQHLGYRLSIGCDCLDAHKLPDYIIDRRLAPIDSVRCTLFRCHQFRWYRWFPYKDNFNGKLNETLCDVFYVSLIFFQFSKENFNFAIFLCGKIEILPNLSSRCNHAVSLRCNNRGW